MKIKTQISSLLAVAILSVIVAQPQSSSAKAGATDVIPGTSKSGLSTGGGGKTTTPAPAPTPALAAGPINFSAVGPIGGVQPVCTGDFRMNAYYPTLLDMAVNINISSLNVPDGTILYVHVVGVGGTLYPYTSNAITIVGGAGLCTEKVFVTLGAGLAGVTITDASGAIIFAGN